VNLAEPSFHGHFGVRHGIKHVRICDFDGLPEKLINLGVQQQWKMAVRFLEHGPQTHARCQSIRNPSKSPTTADNNCMNTERRLTLVHEATVSGRRQVMQISTAPVTHFKLMISFNPADTTAVFLVIFYILEQPSMHPPTTFTIFNL
jgi:hypothetical protein